MLALVASPPAHAQTSNAAGDTRGSANDEPPPDATDAAAVAGGEDGAGTPMPWVEGVPRADRLEAHRIFQEGNTLIREGLFARAVEKYEQALALWDHPGFRYNLAIAQINLDQPIAAHANLERARSYGPAPIGKDLYEQASNLLTLLRNQLAEVEVVCDQPGAHVSLDGEPLFEAPGRHRRLVRPGGHQVVASGAGRIPATRELVLAPGEHTRVDIAPRYLQVRETRRWPVWKPWAVLGAGAAVALAGGALQWSAGRDFRAFDAGVRDLSCNEDAASGGMAGSGCTEDEVPPEVAAQRRRATWQRRAAIAAYAAGGAALATGAVLLVLNRARPVRTYTEQPSAWLMVAPDRFGIAARISF